MSAPSKPWEINSSQTMINNPSYSTGLHSSAPMPPLAPIPLGVPVRRVSRTAPPIPPPPGVMSSNQGYMSSGMGYNSPYSMTGGYGATGYGMGSAMGSYGGYGSGTYGGYGGGYSSLGYGQRGYGNMGGYGMNQYPGQNPTNNLESRFIQLAEESSRPAFDSIESLVRTFGSINFMMESTFGALYSSFRAVLGVAENFGRLRTLFAQVFSSFAVLRTFQWIYKKLLYYLGLRPDNPGREFIWQQAGGAAPVNPEARKTFWPVALFLTLVCSGPYLVWKLLNSLNIAPAPEIAAESNPETWSKCGEPTLVAVAKYPFQSRGNGELGIRLKQNLLIAPLSFQTGGNEWLTASDGLNVGLVPRAYVQIVGQRKARVNAAPPQQAEVPPPNPEPTVVYKVEPNSNPAITTNPTFPTAMPTEAMPTMENPLMTYTQPMPPLTSVTALIPNAVPEIKSDVGKIPN